MKIFTSRNPANGDQVWEGVEADEQDVNQAFEKASTALESWSNLSLEERIRYMEKYQQTLKKFHEDLATVISVETGKPLWESKTEVTSMINKIDISIKAYATRCAEIQYSHGDVRSIARHKPHGVIAVLGPYNFPGHLPNGHIVPALLAGNVVIYKPSEQTPYVGERMVHYWHESGLPEGVLTQLQGGAETGKLLTSHPKLNGLLMTGSWRTGKALLEKFSTQPEKILALEMGGNNPLIYYQAKNLKAAAYLTIQSAYLTTGQRCTCARRLIVVEDHLSEDFIQELIKQIQGIQIGPYTQSPEPFMGPLISEQAVHQMLEAQNKLLSLGAKPILSMQSLMPHTGFITPGLLDVTAIKQRPDEEYFGPLLQLIRVSSWEEAIEEANRTTYGLSAGLLSDSEEAYQQFYRRIHAGVINWNSQTTGASSTLPFGGIGKSGNSRPSAFYAADYCAYPVASTESPSLQLPEKLLPGLSNGN